MTNLLYLHLLRKKNKFIWNFHHQSRRSSQNNYKTYLVWAKASRITHCSKTRRTLPRLTNTSSKEASWKTLLDKKQHLTCKQRTNRKLSRSQLTSHRPPPKNSQESSAWTTSSRTLARSRASTRSSSTRSSTTPSSPRWRGSRWWGSSRRRGVLWHNKMKSCRIILLVMQKLMLNQYNK